MASALPSVLPSVLTAPSAPVVDLRQLPELWALLMQPASLLDLAALLGSLLLAWVIVRAWRGREPGDTASIWLGHHVVDGGLSP